MRERTFWILLFLGLMGLACTACGGGAGADAAEVIDTGDTGGPGDPVPDPDPDPTPTQLDLQLAATLADHDVATPTAPPTPAVALVELGRALFFDKVLSGNRNISCATCHHPTTGSGDDRSLSIGEGGTGLGTARIAAGAARTPRNAPPLWNKGLPSFRRMFWDSRVRVVRGGALDTPEPALSGGTPAAAAIADQLTSALAAQALFPLTSHEEMRGQPGDNELADAIDNLEVWARIMIRLVGTENGAEGGHAQYRAMFQAAFPQVVDFDQFNIGHVGAAIAAFEDIAFRALDSPWDRYLAGDLDSMSAQAKRGAILFYGRADCVRCHAGPLQTDDAHHAIAVPQIGPGREANGDDLGRFEQTGDPDDLYAFRTPTLRNVELTGPWMHDGAYTTLAASVRHYGNPIGALLNYDATQLEPALRTLVDRDPGRNQDRADALSGILRPPPTLAPGDIADLVAFMHALTDEASRDMAAVVPASVPSGLPVAD